MRLRNWLSKGERPWYTCDMPWQCVQNFGAVPFCSSKLSSAKLTLLVHSA